MADEDPEPRLEPRPPERLGPADPLRPSAEPARAAEPATRPRNAWTLIVGLAVAVALVVGIVLGLRHGAGPSKAPAPAKMETGGLPATRTPGPSDTIPTAPATTPETKPPPAAPAPSPPPPAPPRTAPAREVPSAAPTPPPVRAPSSRAAAAVPQNGPKHHRRPVSDAPWLVQTGAFKSREHATRIAHELIKHGWSAYVVDGHDGWILVEVLGFKTHAEAAGAARRIAAKEHLPTLVREARKGGAAVPAAGSRHPAKQAIAPLN